jgi:hypothetical protein
VLTADGIGTLQGSTFIEGVSSHDQQSLANGIRRRVTAMRAVTRRHAAGHHVEAPCPSPAGGGSSL